MVHWWILVAGFPTDTGDHGGCWYGHSKETPIGLWARLRDSHKSLVFADAVMISPCTCPPVCFFFFSRTKWRETKSEGKATCKTDSSCGPVVQGSMGNAREREREREKGIKKRMGGGGKKLCGWHFYFGEHCWPPKTIKPHGLVIKLQFLALFSSATSGCVTPVSHGEG